uniref:hypothetical protein n=1 Tax=Gordonia sp. B7-2 TaxID=3420932 RepID=UPI003D8F2082
MRLRGFILAGATMAAGALTMCTLPVASAAPDRTSPKPLPIAAQQVPNAGITVSDRGITDVFAVSLGVALAPQGATRIAAVPRADNACRTNLKDARMAVTWRNTRTGKMGDEVFPVCAGPRSMPGATIKTGLGRISFTTTILGKRTQTFTIIPGSGSFTRR